MATQALEMSYADRLREQAKALQRRAFDLIREAEDLKAEAVELRTDADRLEREPITPMRHVAVKGRVPLSLVRTDPDFQARLCDALAHSEGLTTGALADHLGASHTRVRANLKRLEEAGKVVRTGATRTTRWYVAGEPDPEPVRTGTATLHVFTKTTPERELEDREVAWTTEAPVPVGALPERDG